MENAIACRVGNPVIMACPAVLIQLRLSLVLNRTSIMMHISPRFCLQSDFRKNHSWLGLPLDEPLRGKFLIKRSSRK
jgi:hypothetical protein